MGWGARSDLIALERAHARAYNTHTIDITIPHGPHAHTKHPRTHTHATRKQALVRAARTNARARARGGGIYRVICLSTMRTFSLSFRSALRPVVSRSKSPRAAFSSVTWHDGALEHGAWGMGYGVWSIGDLGHEAWHVRQICI